MTFKLPLFERYVVDVRLKQFRKLYKHKIVFIDFDSPEGEKMLLRYVASLDPKRQEFKRFAHYF